MPPQGTKLKNQFKRKRLSGMNVDKLEDEHVKTSDEKANSVFPVLQKDQLEDLNDESIDCVLCGEKFTDRHAFTQHLKNHHQKENRCKICGTKLSSTSSLDRHLLVHSKERPYKCLYCPQYFTTNGNMNRHMNKHKGKLANKKNSSLPTSPAENPPTVSVKPEKRVSDADVSEVPPVKKPKIHQCDSEPIQAVKPNPPRPKSKKKDKDPSPPLLFSLEFSSRNFPIVASSEGMQDTVPRKGTPVYKCITCDQAFLDLASLSEHEASHQGTPNPEYYCISCQASHDSFCEFTRHRMNSSQPVGDLEKPQAQFLKQLGLYKNTQTIESAQSVEPEKKDTGAFNEKSTEPLKEDSVNVSAKKMDTNDYIENSDNGAEKHRSSESSNDFADISSILSNVSLTSVSQEQSSLEMTLLSQHTAKDSNLNGGSAIGAETGNQKKMKEKTTHKCLKEGCRYTSPDKSCVARHMITHTKEHHFICTKCYSPFTTKANGERHARNKHHLTKSNLNGVIVYNDLSKFGDPKKCRYCEEMFPCDKALQYHLRAINHSCNQKPFKCAKCGQGFGTRNNYNRHYNTQHKTPDISKELFADEMAKNCIERDERSKAMKGSTPAVNEEKSSDDTADLSFNGFLEASSQMEEISEVQLHGNDGDASDLNCASNTSSNSMHREHFEDHGYTSEVSTYSRQSKENELNENQDTLEVYCLDSIKNGGNDNSIGSWEANTEPQPLDLSIRALDLRSNHSERQGPRTGLRGWSSMKMGVPSTILDVSVEHTQKHFERYSNAQFLPNLYNPDRPTTQPQDLSANPLMFPSHVPTIAQDLQDPKSGLASLNRVVCEYCGKTFSLKTNKNRHVKQKHEAQLKLMNEKSGHLFTTNRGNSLLPKETILSRVLQNTDSNKPTEREGAATDIFQNRTLTKGGNLQVMQEVGNNSDSENVDLASVKSVINTANSPCFNQYLTEGINCDATDKNNNTTASPPNGEKESFHHKGKSKENKYTCNKCLRSFQWGSGLKRHSVKHTGFKPYVCEQCDSKCSTKSNLTRHYRNKHRNSDSESGSEFLSAVMSIELNCKSESASLTVGNASDNHLIAESSDNSSDAEVSHSGEKE